MYMQLFKTLFRNVNVISVCICLHMSRQVEDGIYILQIIYQNVLEVKLVCVRVHAHVCE